MAGFAQTHIEAYVFRRRARRVEFLALRRAPKRRVLPGVWQPVTGKRELLERGIESAVREVREETGLEPRRVWCLETVTTFFDARRDRFVVLPLFAAEVGARETVRLSAEHAAFAWLSAREAGERFLWESQRRALAAIQDEILRRRKLADALQIPESMTTWRRREPRRPA